MPNKEAIREWVDTLRSGRYKQGTGCLKKYLDDGAKHCCLGVAAEEYSSRVGELFEYTPSKAPSPVDRDDVSNLWNIAYLETCFIDQNPRSDQEKIKYIAEKDNLPPSVAHYLGLKENPRVNVTLNELKGEVYHGRMNQSTFNDVLNNQMDDDEESIQFGHRVSDPDEELEINLAALNDCRVPFPVIANIIEDNYL